MNQSTFICFLLPTFSNRVPIPPPPPPPLFSPFDYNTDGIARLMSFSLMRFDEPESLVDLLLSGRAILCIPSVNELLLPPFTAFKVVGVESLF